MLDTSKSKAYLEKCQMEKIKTVFIANVAKSENKKPKEKRLEGRTG